MNLPGSLSLIPHRPAGADLRLRLDRPIGGGMTVGLTSPVDRADARTVPDGSVPKMQRRMSPRATTRSQSFHRRRSAARIVSVTLRPSAPTPSPGRPNALAGIVHSGPRVSIRGCVTSLPRR